MLRDNSAPPAGRLACRGELQRCGQQIFVLLQLALALFLLEPHRVAHRAEPPRGEPVAAAVWSSSGALF